MPGKSIKHLPKREWYFVSDAALQGILRRDYEELRRLAKTDADKSTVVLCGTIVEALLAGLLMTDEQGAIRAWQIKNPTGQPRPFDKWTLYDLVQASVQLGILDGAVEMLAGALRDFRNLIHPLVQVRKAVVLNDGIVKSAVALLGNVLESIEAGQVQEVVKRIHDWADRRGLVPNWSAAGAFVPRLNADGQSFTPILLRRNRIQIQFGRLKSGRSSFRYKAKREELRRRLNRIGFNLAPRDRDVYPSISLGHLARPGMCDDFIDVLDWIVSTIRDEFRKSR